MKHGQHKGWVKVPSVLLVGAWVAAVRTTTDLKYLDGSQYPDNVLPGVM
jgi:hypothetical protein